MCVFFNYSEPLPNPSVFLPMSRLRAGAIAGEQPKGLAQMFVSKVVSQTPAESITTYQAQSLSTGAVVVRVD